MLSSETNHRLIRASQFRRGCRQSSKSVMGLFDSKEFAITLRDDGRNGHLA